MNTNFVDELMSEAQVSVQEILKSEAANRRVLARYTAAFAVNYTDWIGRTLVWIQDEYAWDALNEMLKAETKENRVELLYDFAKLSDAVPKKKDFDVIRNELYLIRDLLSCPRNGGIFGISFLVTLKLVSELFVPDLVKKAEGLGCRNFKYTDIQSNVGREGSELSVETLKKEIIKCSNHLAEEDLKFYARSGMKQATKLLTFIYG
jgi:hypothetical protein